MFNRFWVAVLAAVLSLAHAGTQAQTWPLKPIRFILPFAAGGGGDSILRPLSQRLADALGGSVVLENLPGAGGAIGVKAALAAPADDHTFLMISNSHTVLERLNPGRGYELLRDLVPVAGMAALPMMLVVNPKVPARDLPEFVAYARANPGKLAYATPGIGTIYHLVTEEFAQDLKLSMLHVPYKASTVARQDLIGGQVDVMFDGVGTMKPILDSGRVRALAVTSPQPNAYVPGMPPIASVIPGFQEDIWLGFMAKAGTSPAVIKRVQDEVLKLVRSDGGRESLTNMGVLPMPMDAASFGAMLKKDIDKWERVIKTANVKLE